MCSIGPQMPSEPSKRKRTPEDDGNGASSPPRKHSRGPEPSAKNQHEIELDDSDDDYGPQAPAPPKPSVVGPSLPISNQEEINIDSDAASDTGPIPPPAVDTHASSSDDSDDDYGPALPSASKARAAPIGPALPPSQPTPQRDSWMLAPPTSSSYSERDPTRLRARKFASNPSANKSTGVSSVWTETPEEKLRRLQDTVLGRADPAGDAAPAGQRKTREEEARDRRIAASIEATRGKSLYDQHQKKRKQEGEEAEQEDDPSKRAFDREKDMALGGKIGTSQRRQLMNNAADFGGRFQKGSFL
ncbi:hypothetical protein S40288_02766 [Stachybotrys chartarum IBT 40288]|nr:hypothetical protein S40288_02766 [Stachybotrys chartarum IBT 40288]